jgi:hypothetical protein
MASVAYILASRLRPLYHDYEEDLAFVPPSEPAHPPAIYAIAHYSRLAETEESGLDLQFLPSAQLGRPGW